jgi:hypothetical protein
LETPEAEDDAAFMPKPIEELEQARSWGSGAETDEVAEDEEEEEPGRGGWRPGGLDEIEEPAVPSGGAKAKDWREEAFHGNSPASISSGRQWSPASTTQVAEVAEAPSVGVSTLESKPSEAAAPFAGDAWAAALASTVEDKIVAHTEAPAAVNDVAAEVAAPAEEAKAAEPVMAAPTQTADTGNWAAASESPWELEAKKASLLAATWDAPAAVPESVAEAAKFLEEEPEAVMAEAPAAETATEFVAQSSSAATAEVAAEPAAAEVSGVEALEPAKAEEPMQFVASESFTAEAPTESVYVAEAPLDVNATQELPAFTEGESAYSAAPLNEEAAEPVETGEPTKVEEMAESAAPAAAVADPEAAPAESLQQPDMDALVARVLAKMNPDVLQRVTQQILKPVIEAIIKDELDAKK